MGYTTGTINFTLTDSARYTIIDATSDAEWVQIYVAGELQDWKEPSGGAVKFYVRKLKHREYVRLLAVTDGSEEIDYYATAWPDDQGNRITTKVPTQPGYLAGDKWKVLKDDSEIYESPVYPYQVEGNPIMGGRGLERGVLRGYENYGVGRGNWRGLQRGMEPRTLLHETNVTVPGDYEMAVTIEDEIGNATAQYEDDITHDTFPDEPESLTVSSYTAGTLTLAFTESTDL